MSKSILLSILMGTLLSASGASATTYYIDWASGADTNDGLTKSTPWKRAPGMVGCSDSCLSKKSAGVKPGDQFILKGGVTWPNAVFGWLINFSGNSTVSSPGCSGSGCIYVGVDQTWYSGESWQRPIMNAQGTKTGTDIGGVSNYLLRLYANYIIVDSLEFTGLYWDSTDTKFGESTNISLATGAANRGTNITLKNIYIHGWSHDTYANGARHRSCAIVGDTAVPNNNANTILQDSVIDGSDTAVDSCTGVFGSPPYIERNYFANMTSALILNGAKKVSGNTITNIGECFDAGAHKNAILINCAQDIEISNNNIGNLSGGTVGIWSAPYQGYTATIFNNVLYNTDPTQILSLSRPVINNTGCTSTDGSVCDSSGSHYVYSNTIEAGFDSNPNSTGISIHPATTEARIYNNHIITNATSPNMGVWRMVSAGTTVITASHNLVQSKAIANSQGYTIADVYPFGGSGSGLTVGTGMNLSNLPGIPSAALSSAALGVEYDAVNHRVIGPRITPEPRGEYYDIGAYQFSRKRLSAPLNPKPIAP